MGAVYVFNMTSFNTSLVLNGARAISFYAMDPSAGFAPFSAAVQRCMNPDASSPAIGPNNRVTVSQAQCTTYYRLAIDAPSIADNLVMYLFANPGPPDSPVALFVMNDRGVVLSSDTEPRVTTAITTTPSKYRR
jgi:hypothetical protein